MSNRGWPPRFSSYDDDDAQVDGEGVDGDGMVRFVPQGTGTPWLREGLPPWHMWGNSITLDPIAISSEDTAAPDTTGQLIKVSYKRPETWHWLFAARILRAPGRPAISVSSVIVTVNFDLIIGVSRSIVELRGFETFQWAWVGEQVVPKSHVMWSTNGRTPALSYTPLPDPAPDPATRRLVDQITAQDIQLSCRISIQSEDGIGDPGAVEVSAFLAPKSHIRPDWFVSGPPELMFPGGETQGK